MKIFLHLTYREGIEVHPIEYCYTYGYGAEQGWSVHSFTIKRIASQKAAVEATYSTH